MTNQRVHTDQAPAAIGPYSQAIIAQGWVFCSGQIPLDPHSGEVVAGPIQAQTRLALTNLRSVLQAAGCSLEDVVRCTVYLTDMGDFTPVNEVYAEFFGETRPARAAVQVAGLPKGVDIEIDAIAVLPQRSAAPGR